MAGFWVPEMIAIAGGEDVAGDPGLAPAEVGWGELASLRPDVLIVMVDGYLEDVQAQAMEVWEHLEGLGADRVFAVAAQAAFSDPGPRLIDGVELIGHLLHPDLMDPPGQHPVHPPAQPAARRASLAPHLGAPQPATASAEDEAEHADRGHRAELDREAVRGAGLAERPCSPATIRRPQRTPATRPPTWAPMLIAPSAKVKTRLKTIRKPIWPAIASRLRPRAMMKVAPRTPKIAPEAPALTVSGLNQQGDERARQQRRRSRGR